jgi:hypothetical protein
MVPRLHLEFLNKDSYPRFLANLSERLTDWRTFWVEYFLPRYTEEVQQNFETEGELVGGWPDLSPSYAAWKTRHFPGTRILERTRRLRNSLSHGAGSGPDTVLQVRPLELRWGTKVPYSKYLVPERPILPKVDPKRWRQFVENWMSKRVSEAKRAS